MRILAFDTSTQCCSAALWVDGRVLCREMLAGKRHTEFLLPMIQEMLADAGAVLTQLDGIAFGSGPGSFTGLRIACGVAQGIALGADLPVLGISTLEALAQQVGDGNVVTALDARMGEIYYATYIKFADNWQSVNPPILCSPGNAPPILGNNWIACGSGFDVYNEVLLDRYNGCISRVHGEFNPHAREITQLAAPRFLEGLGVDPATISPLYIRNKVALKENER